jgi:uncharacterized membrane protein YhaH (DUF805 family)
MTFNGAIRSVFRSYATFTGRSARSEFWWWMLFSTLTRGFLGFIYTMTMLALIMPLSLAAANNQINDVAAISGAIFNPMYFVLLAWDLAILVPTLAVMARRFHDTGRSGWFVLITFIPVVGTILMIVFLVEESRPEANAWGDRPVVGHAPEAPTGGPVAGKK